MFFLPSKEQLRSEPNGSVPLSINQRIDQFKFPLPRLKTEMRSSQNVLPTLDPMLRQRGNGAADDFNFKTRSSFTDIPSSSYNNAGSSNAINNGNANGLNQSSIRSKKTINSSSTSNMQQMVSRNFIKDFSSKLDKHQTDIERRDEFIKELELTLEKLRNEYIKERQISDEKSRQIIIANEATEKVNSKMKINQLRMEEMMSKVQFYEREISKMRESDERNEDSLKNREEATLARIAELEQKVKDQIERNLALETDTRSIHNEANRKIAEALAAQSQLKKELQQREEELRIASDKLSAFDSEKRQVESNLQNIRRQSTLQVQELQNKLRETEASSKSMNQLKEENSKMISQLREFKLRLESLESKQAADAKTLSDALAEKGTLASNLSDAKNELKASVESGNSLQKSVSELEQQLEIKNEKMQNMLKELENTRNKLSNGSSDSEASKGQMNDLKKKYDESMKGLVGLQQQMANIQRQSKKLDEAEKEITKSLKCNFCDQFIKDPITVIPCGHSFCLNCKKAYAKDCIRCGPKVKVEAMYRNELLDDIIAMVKILQSLQASLKV